jgi:ribose transport system ATP-binding protein
MPTARAEQPFHLEATGLRKSFSGNEVLHGVDIEARGGRVLALLGENGAGKSTTVKILAGDYRRDDGEIRVNGEPVRIDSPADAQAVGVKVIFQEFMDAPELTVAENIALGAMPNRFGIVNWRRTEQQARKILAELGVRMDPARTVESLGVAERQILEIARALVGDARLLILDEPTSALAAEEVEALFEFIRGLRQRGVAIIYITHRLDELAEIADDVVIFRDGYVVASGLVEDMTTDDLVDAMVGKRLHHEFEELQEHEEIGHAGETVPPVLRLRDVTITGHTDGVSLEVAPGEIVALFGRLGCGAVELAEAVFGLRPMGQGAVEIDGVDGKPHTPSQAIQRGVGFVPIDRKTQGILQGLNLSENISVASWSQRPLLSVLRPSVVARAFDRWQERLNISAKEGASQAIETLSGGNQQKVVLGRWLEHRSKVLVLAEPTRGVDVGARAEIYQVLRGLAADGVGILVISSDMDEVLRIADRVVVLSRGVVTAELGRRELDRPALAHAASMRAEAL